MPNFKTREEAEAWLKTRRPDEIALIASRAAMRALPVLATGELEDMLEVLLAVFRALSTSHFVSIWPDSGKEISHDTLIKRGKIIYDIVTNRPADVVPSDSPSNSAAIAAVGAVEAAELAYWNPTGHHSAGSAGHAFYASAFKAINHADGADTNLGIVDESEADAYALEKGATVAELSAMPLWPEGKTPKALISLWDDLKFELPDGEDWDVWTEWYDTRLRGTRAHKEIEKARIQIPDKGWFLVNRSIKQFMEEIGGASEDKNLHNPGDLGKWIENNPEWAASLTKSSMVQHLVKWFHHFYEDPVHHAPYNSQEGGYLYIYGGPYDATEEFYDNFDGIVSEDAIKLAVDQVQNDCYEWGPSDNHPSRRSFEEEVVAERYERDEHDLYGFEKIAADAQPAGLGNPEELRARAEVEECAEAVEAALPESLEYGGIGHNRPPGEYEIREEDLPAVRESVAAIKTEAQAETPDIQRVAQNASVLKRFVGWVAGKLDVTINEFCKAFGKALGKVVGYGLPAGIIALPYWGKIVALFESVWKWISAFGLG